MKYPDKIELVLSYKHDPDDDVIFTERVDAEKFGQYYRLVHVPAFARNIAYGDIVKVDYEDGDFHFDELIEESGYSVVHIVIFKEDSKQRVVNKLVQSRCGVNTHVAENYLVVSVAPTVLYQEIQSYLVIEKACGAIDFRESCLSRLHASKQN